MILNVEEDHMDFFKDIDEIRESFYKFAHKTPADGAVIINGEIEGFEELVDQIAGRVITYGPDSTFDYYWKDVVFYQGCASFSLMHKGEELGTIRLQVPGIHNVSNAVASATVALEMGISFDAVQIALANFGGTVRRFEFKGKIGDITVIDDYAHHPTEITVSLKAAANYPHNRVVCVFQPHTYTRTKAFLPEFAKALSLADVVVLADIYAAREQNTLGISSLDLLHELEKLGTECYYFPSFDEIEDFLLKKCINNDMLITMGAGDILRVGEHLLGQ